MKDIIVKRNEVVRASYRLSPNEQTIILTAISKVPQNISDQQLYSLNINEMALLSGVNERNAYRDFKDAAIALYRRELMLTNGSKKLTRWVQTVDYLDGEGVIKIRFSNDILPYITNIKENFTCYNLKHVASFKSTYGVRVYELIKQWANTRNSIEISIEEIKDMFQLSDGYALYSNLKRKVIEPALKDINSYSDMAVQFIAIKTGRKVTHLEFKFKSKQSKPKVNHEYIEKYARPGESYDDARSRLVKEIES